MESQEYIEKLIKGDPIAFRELYDNWKNQIFSLALSFIPIQEEAEDMVQEVFIEVHRHLQDFRKEAKLSTWMHKITVNQCLMHIRAKSRKKRSGIMVRLFTRESPQIVDPATLNHPGIRLENKEKAASIYKSIEALPDKQKIAFTLTQIEGLSYTETCKIMELSQSSVESLIFRARKTLKENLAFLRK